MVTYLHIGRHKTGTTSIQCCLTDNRPALANMGYWYPPGVPKGVAHHGIARALLPDAIRDPANAQLVTSFLADTAPHKNVIVSSERFQSVSPQTAGEYFAPQSTKIIVYIREQLDYLVSSYSQMIQAETKTQTLSEYARKFYVNYEEFLGQWTEVYGPANISVGLFQRESLLNGDVVRDFLNRVGIPEHHGLNTNDADRNPSIGWSVVEFKRRLNALIPAENLEALNSYNAFEKLAAKSELFRRKPRLSPEFCGKIRARYTKSNENTFQQYRLAPAGFAMRSFSEGTGMQEWQADVPAILDGLSEVAPKLALRAKDALAGRDLPSMLPDALS